MFHMHIIQPVVHLSWQVHLHTIISVDMVIITTVITITITINTVIASAPSNITIIISALIIGRSSYSVKPTPLGGNLP